MNKVVNAVLIFMLLVVSAISVSLYFRQMKAGDELDISGFPMEIDGWRGKDIKLEEYNYEILETRNLVNRVYTNEEEGNLYLFIIYSETNRSVFHPPEVCIMGSGVEIIDKDIDTISYNGEEISLNRLLVKSTKSAWVDLYCYKADDFHTDNYLMQQAIFSLKQPFKKRVKGATIRVSVPIEGDKDAALQRGKAFFKKALRIIDGM